MSQLPVDCKSGNCKNVSDCNIHIAAIDSLQSLWVYEMGLSGPDH